MLNALSRGHLYQPVQTLLLAWWAVWAGGRAAPEEVGEAVAPHEDPLAVRASLEHVPGPQCISAHGRGVGTDPRSVHGISP